MIKLFTDSDLDGLGCSLIAKMAFGEKADVTYCTYRNLNQRVEGFLNNPQNNETLLYITDLSVNPDVEKKLVERFNAEKHVQMVDHHVTALHFNEHKWGFVKVEYEDGRKTCATSLFYDFLLEKGDMKRNIALEQFIELVRQYDTWEWEINDNPIAKRLNDLFSIIGREQFEAEMLKRLTENTESFSFNELETYLLEIEEKKIERYIRSKNRKLVQTFVKDYCVGIIHAESYHSELGNELNKRNPHLDLIVILNIGNKAMGFRTIYDHVDVSELAGSFGGGGHPKASGCGLTEETFKLFVVDVFDLPPRRIDPDKNEFNVPGSQFGNVYMNRKDEITLVKPVNDKWEVHHNKKHEATFDTFDEADRFVKRQYVSSLQFDNDYLKYWSNALKVKVDELKSNFNEIMKKNNDGASS